MRELLNQLHDIEGLDPVSMWPLAPGWWLLFALVLCLAFGIGYWIALKIAFNRSWRSDAWQKLSQLEKNLSEDTAPQAVMMLSEYLRRLALSRFPRKECAGLTGKAWLKWLTKQDPQKFDWENRGIALLEVPYANEKAHLSVREVKELIQAAKKWTV